MHVQDADEHKKGIKFGTKTEAEFTEFRDYFEPLQSPNLSSQQYGITPQSTVDNVSTMNISPSQAAAKALQSYCCKRK